MNQKKSIFIGLAMLMALFVTVVTFAGQSDQGLKAFEGQTNTSQNNTANTIKGKKNRGNSNTGMDSNMPMNSNTAPNTNGTPR